MRGGVRAVLTLDEVCHLPWSTLYVIEACAMGLPLKRARFCTSMCGEQHSNENKIMLERT